MLKKPILRLLAVALVLIALFIFAKDIFGNALVKNEVLLKRGPGEYLEIKHIVLRGSNKKIGQAVGDIAQSWLKIKLMPLPSPLYAKARNLYIKNNYPALLERMKGVARSYKVPWNSNYAFDSLFYDVGPMSCSTVFYPGNSTTTEHPIFCHNLDFYVVGMSEFMGMKPVKGEDKLYSRDYVMEVYPKNAYGYIVIGGLELLSGGMSGMNEHGVVTSILAEHGCPTSEDPAQTGLTPFQMMREVLETCRTVEEAKLVILRNKLAFAFEGVHFQVADSFGNSFICDIDPKDVTYHFTDNKQQPQVMTNHSAYLYPDPKKFPKYSKRETYNTYYRYNALLKFIKEQQGKKIAPLSAWEAMSRAYAHTHDADEGAANPSPCRTLWTILYDMQLKTVQVKFYLKDGPTDKKTGDPTLLFSKVFDFKVR
ncbi:C45 family autoproteolytic acyltransferase/hydrolase [Candidatus Margulisiibacteriota bacterium]